MSLHLNVAEVLVKTVSAVPVDVINVIVPSVPFPFLQRYAVLGPPLALLFLFCWHLWSVVRAINVRLCF
jgi:hypothetical protein